MNTKLFEGKWDQIKGEIKMKWSELSDDDLQFVDGSFDRLLGIIKEKYGKSKEEAKKEIDEWFEKRD